MDRPEAKKKREVRNAFNVPLVNCFESLLKNLMAQGRFNQMKVYSKAVASMKLYPLPILQKSQALLLEGVGDKVADMVEVCLKKLYGLDPGANPAVLTEENQQEDYRQRMKALEDRELKKTVVRIKNTKDHLDGFEYHRLYLDEPKLGSKQSQFLEYVKTQNLVFADDSNRPLATDIESLVKTECITVDWITNSIRLTDKGTKIAQHHIELQKKARGEREPQNSRVDDLRAKNKAPEEGSEQLRDIMEEIESLEKEVYLEDEFEDAEVSENRSVEDGAEIPEDTQNSFGNSFQLWKTKSLQVQANSSLATKEKPVGTATSAKPGSITNNSIAEPNKPTENQPGFEFKSLFESTYPFPYHISNPQFTPVSVSSSEISSFEVKLLVDTRERKQFKGSQFKLSTRSKSPFQGRKKPVFASSARSGTVAPAATDDSSGSSNINLERQLQSLGIKNEACMLSLGDFLWTADVKLKGRSTSNTLVLPFLVERKTLGDLLSSVMDGRYGEQMGRLKTCGIRRVYYVLEGDVERLRLEHRKTVASAISRLRAQYRFVVVRTKDLGETLQWIWALHTQVLYHVKPLLPQENPGPSNKPPNTMVFHSELTEFQSKLRKGDSATVGQIWSSMIRSFPGVGKETSAKLRTLYPTAAAFLQTKGNLEDGYQNWSTPDVREHLRKAMFG